MADPAQILPDGQMVSLPIPDPGSDLRYADCHTADGVSYLELLQRLGIETIRHSNGPTATRVPVRPERVEGWDLRAFGRLTWSMRDSIGRRR